MMTLNKINPILKCVLCLVLCVCMCFSMCFLRPVEVKVSVSIGAAVSIFCALLGIFGWTMEIGENISEIDFSPIADGIGDTFSAAYHWLCGDYAEYFYEKNGYLTEEMIDDGWYVDDRGYVLNDKYFVENAGDIFDKPIDWEVFEETGDITYSMQVAHYESIWQSVQNWMHGGYYTTLGALVKEVSTEPTLTELRDSVYNLYLGSVGYFGSDILNHSPETKSVYDFGNEKIKVTFDCFNPRSSEGNYIKFAVYNSERDSWNPFFYSYFSSFSDNGYSVFDLFNNNVLTEDICTGEWGVSVPYTVNDQTYLYLFSYSSDILIKSSLIKYHTSYDSISYDSSTFSDCIEKFDEDIKNYAYSSSSSSTDDTVRNSATANKYAGTVDDDDGNPVPVTAPGKAGTTTVTGGSSVTNPVTGVKGEDYANGTSVPMTGTVTGSATVTQTDTGVKTDVGTVVSTATVDYPDGFESWEPSIKLLTKFPFCIPYDFYSCFAILYKEPKELYFEIPFKMDQYGLDEKVVIDLRQFDSVVLILRYLILIGFIMFLTLKTRELIKG